MTNGEAPIAKTNQPNGLLAALVPFGVFVQSEVALTGSICWLLGLEGGSGALIDSYNATGSSRGSMVNGSPRWLVRVAEPIWSIGGAIRP